MTQTPRATELKGKRLAAIDFGQARIGVAVCDEMHIVVSTRPVIVNIPTTVWEEMHKRIDMDRIDVLLVGMPRLHDDRVTPIMESIREFIEQLRERLSIPVYEIDEAFSTQRAFQAMREAGNSKKTRQTKGRKDQVAAAVMLRDFLEGTI